MFENFNAIPENGILNYIILRTDIIKVCMLEDVWIE